MANSLAYDSVDLGGASYGLTLLRTPLPRFPSPVLDIQTPAQGRGFSQGVNYDPRVMALPMGLAASSHADIQTKLDALALVLDVTADKKIQLDQITDRYWMGRLNAPIESFRRGSVGAGFMLEFLLADRAAYSTTEEDNTFSIVSDPDTFNVESAAAVAGTDFVYPVWYIRNTTGGNITTLTLNNTTTSESLTWNATLEDNRWLKIDLTNFVISKSASTNADATAETYSASMGGWATGSVWPRLQPNVQNAMSVSGLSSGTARWIYRARFK